MKKILLYCSFIFVFNSGCQKDFLGRAPISDTNTESFYHTAEDMQQSVNAAYSFLRENGQYGQTLYAVGEVASDNTEILDAQAGIDISQIDDFTTLTNNGLLNEMWNAHYKGILSCNAVIDRIGNVTMEESLKNRYVAEVRFLRALMYFNMVRTFGDVPLVIKEILKAEEGYAYTRNASAEVYDQIVADLTFAAQTLPVKYAPSDVGRATTGAARGLLTKVYLTKQNWEQAAAQAKMVMDLGIYVLMPEYADVFAIPNKNNAESLFEVQYKKGGYGLGSPFNNRFAPRQSGQLISTIGAGLGHNHPTAEMARAYEAGDKRKEASMAEGYQSGNQFVAIRYVKKYLDPALFEAGDADNNWPILRYADVLLMRAEALNELGYSPNGEALELLNQIRKRAGLPEKNTSTLPDQGSFRDAIAQERRVELAYENHRWFDLVRTGRALEVLQENGENIQTHQLLFPIPQVQIDINPNQITQNPGY